MQPDDHICLCFGVSLGKIQTYLARENPQVASLISECLGAGTGCGWCVPYLKDLHEQHQSQTRPKSAFGQSPTIEGSAQDYQSGRIEYRKSGEREDNL